MIHWQYIKGAYQNNSSNTNLPYTFIDFYGGNNFSSTTTSVTEEMLPIIQLASDTNRTNPQSAGHIVTSGVEQTFSEKIIFDNQIECHDVCLDSSGQEIFDFSDASIFYIGYGAQSIEIGNDDANTLIVGPLHASEYMRVGAATSHPIAGDLSAKAIYSDTICEAQYFNATSDRRAKTDIKPINQSVLPLVINTQLYSFKYKDLDTPSIGIIAQDVQDVDFDGFSLVDNKEATGQDMDYMSIHESKLIYVLWKAVQEQQKEIEEL